MELICEPPFPLLGPHPHSVVVMAHGEMEHDSVCLFVLRHDEKD